MASIIYTSNTMISKYRKALPNQLANSCIFKPSCILHNPDSGWELRPRKIEGISIEQKFASEFMDTITMTVILDPNEYTKAQANMQNLECTIILKKVSQFYLYEFDEDPIVWKFVVHVTDQTDLAQQTNVGKIGKVNMENDKIEPNHESQLGLTLPLTLHMYEKEAYEVRHRGITCVTGTKTKQVSVEDMIHWVIDKVEVSNLECTPPENPSKYENFIIPKSTKFSECFPYIQEHYGIYSKSLAQYYTGGMFYLFPPFDTDPSTTMVKETVHGLLGPENYFSGMSQYHSIQDGGDIMFVTITPPTIEELNSQGAENQGNAVVYTQADSVKDQAAVLQKDGKLMRNEKALTTITRQNTGGDMQGQAINAVYIGETSNPYPELSKMAATNGGAMNISWPRALPFLIKPGQSFVYHYDDKGQVYKTRKGRILGVTYQSGSVVRADAVQPFIFFDAAIGVFLEPKEASPEETQITV